MDEEEEPEYKGYDSRNRKLMKRFLNGTLNIGSSMRITRNGQTIQFAVHGDTQQRLQSWWEQRKTHVNQRTVNAQLLVHKEAVKDDYQLVQDISMRKHPFTHVHVRLQPASHIDIRGQAKRTTTLVDYRPLVGAPFFYIQNISRKKRELNLLDFIVDTVSYKVELDRLAAIKAASRRPFITLRRSDPIPQRHLLSLPSLSWLQYQSYEAQKEEIVDESIISEASQVAMRATSQQFHAVQSIRDIFNDDVSQQREPIHSITSSDRYNPTLLLSRFSLPPSQTSASTNSPLSQQGRPELNTAQVSEDHVQLSITTISTPQEQSTVDNSTCQPTHSPASLLQIWLQQSEQHLTPLSA